MVNVVSFFSEFIFFAFRSGDTALEYFFVFGIWKACKEGKRKHQPIQSANAEIGTTKIFCNR